MKKQKILTTKEWKNKVETMKKVVKAKRLLAQGNEEEAKRILIGAIKELQ